MLQPLKKGISQEEIHKKRKITGEKWVSLAQIVSLVKLFKIYKNIKWRIYKMG